MLELLKALIEQKVTAIVVLLGSVFFFFAIFAVDISKGGVQPRSTPSTLPLILGVTLIVVSIAGSAVGEALARRSVGASSSPEASFKAQNTIDTVWYAEWRLGPKAKLYKETLKLQEHPSGAVSGTRWLETADGATEYRVVGFARGGFYWLEYHDEKDRGGGTLLLHEFTSGRLRGLINAANCDTGRIRCLTNHWVPKINASTYDPASQEQIGEI